VLFQGAITKVDEEWRNDAVALTILQKILGVMVIQKGKEQLVACIGGASLRFGMAWGSEAYRTTSQT
jgi:hypothetical protein